MSLVSQIQALAARIGAEDKTQNERLDLLETSLGDVNGNMVTLTETVGPSSSLYDPILKAQVFS